MQTWRTFIMQTRVIWVFGFCLTSIFIAGITLFRWLFLLSYLSFSLLLSLFSACSVAAPSHLPSFSEIFHHSTEPLHNNGVFLFSSFQASLYSACVATFQSAVLDVDASPHCLHSALIEIELKLVWIYWYWKVHLRLTRHSVCTSWDWDQGINLGRVSSGWTKSNASY